MFSGLLQTTINRAIRTRFPCGSVLEGLNQAAYNNSPVHYAKGTRSHLTLNGSLINKTTTVFARSKDHAIVLPLSVGIWFQVLFHSPCRGSFHCSLALLFAIGRQLVFSLGGWSPRIHTEFRVLDATWDDLKEEK